jgi:vacuolar-type H+-ATPase subunit I/STV1
MPLFEFGFGKIIAAVAVVGATGVVAQQGFSHLEAQKAQIAQLNQEHGELRAEVASLRATNASLVSTHDEELRHLRQAHQDEVLRLTLDIGTMRSRITELELACSSNDDNAVHQRIGRIQLIKFLYEGKECDRAFLDQVSYYNNLNYDLSGLRDNSFADLQ